MAATTHGTAYLYGVDGTYFASAQIVTISLAKSDKINEFVENNSGQVASSRHDDQTDTLTATLRVESGFTRNTVAAKVTLAPAEAGSQQFDGDYRVTDVTETKSAKGFVDYNVTMVKDEYLTLT